MAKLTDTKRHALKWALVGICWLPKKGAYDGGIRRTTVKRLLNAGLVYEDGSFTRITPAGRLALQESDRPASRESGR